MKGCLQIYNPSIFLHIIIINQSDINKTQDPFQWLYAFGTKSLLKKDA